MAVCCRAARYSAPRRRGPRHAGAFGLIMVACGYNPKGNRPQADAEDGGRRAIEAAGNWCCDRPARSPVLSAPGSLPDIQ